MNLRNQWSNRVVGVFILMTGFSAAHLIDDFLYGIPADFGLSNPATQILALIFFIVAGLLLTLSARGKRAGYFANILLGSLLTAADLLKHGDEGLFAAAPWRSGVISRGLAFGLMLTALSLAAVSYGAWRHVVESDKLETAK